MKKAVMCAGTSLLILGIVAAQSRAEDVPVTITKPGEHVCVDAPPGRDRQLECIKKLNGQVRVLDARVCKLPDETWILNLRWRCVDKEH